MLSGVLCKILASFQSSSNNCHIIIDGLYFISIENFTSTRPVKLRPVGDPKTYDQPLFVEIHQEFEMGVSQVVRVPSASAPKTLYDVEVEWMVGPISIEDGKGKEFIHRVR